MNRHKPERYQWRALALNVVYCGRPIKSLMLDNLPKLINEIAPLWLPLNDMRIIFLTDDLVFSIVCLQRTDNLCNIFLTNLQVNYSETFYSLHH